MPIDTHDPTAALSQLSTEIAETVKGYEVMADEGDPDLREAAVHLHDMHESHASQILNAVETMGGRPEDAGSMMGAVRRAVSTSENWLGRLDREALPRIVEGEERLLASYDEALAATTDHPDIHEMLRQQRAIVEARIDVLRRD
jgi:uncharacterized protein (TIGR02284 family)